MSKSINKILNSRNFSELIYDKKELIIIQFHDEENVSCQIMDRVFKRLQVFFTDGVIYHTIARGASPEIWELFNIYHTPAFLFIKENSAVEKVQGLISYDHFKSVVEKFI